MTAAPATAHVTLRPMAADDCEMVFTWRNRPEIVRLSSSGRPVDWEDHLSWFRRRAADGTQPMFVIEAAGWPAGQLRFDAEADRAYRVTIYLVAESTGRGIGVAALRAGCGRLLAEGRADTFTACVQAGNLPSRKAFARAGFRDTEPPAPCPGGHVRMVLTAGGAHA
ncbi:MAG: GNAT family N-acetyltransferase [Hyphomicrobiales bacterium]|nr:GNAT family N-acetyltransferase [Hyphomicrobiales bacterium]